MRAAEGFTAEGGCATRLRDSSGDLDGLCDDERLYYLADANMNVTALVEPDGDVAERYLYDPYGDVTVTDGAWAARPAGSACANTVLFAGTWRDSETGLLHVRNRMYHVRLGLWLRRDPKGYVDGMGLYEYVRGLPTTRADPTGWRPGELPPNGTRKR